MAPMDIKQFNALIHSKKSDSELISVLRDLMSADSDTFSGSASMLWFFW
jgi:hypothetical protein